MKMRFLTLSLVALPLLALPAAAQNDYYYRNGEVPITGAQMTDFPSSRANTTESGSFLRPNVPTEPGYGRNYYYYYGERRDYYGDRYSDRPDGRYDRDYDDDR